jgi:hypothetical protein
MQLSRSLQDELKVFIECEMMKIKESFNMINEICNAVKPSPDMTISINSINDQIDAYYNKLKTPKIIFGEDTTNENIYTNIKILANQIIKTYVVLFGGTDNDGFIFIISTDINNIFDKSIRDIDCKIRELTHISIPLTDN